MENLIELVMQYQKTNAETTLKTILQRLYPMMRKQLKKVNITFQEDLLQEIQFLTTFIDKNQLLTQKEVAQKLGYSQQKVSRILNQIKQKYKKNKFVSKNKFIFAVIEVKGGKKNE